MISNRPEIRQKQTLAMTPQLVQAIRLLQFSRAELNQYLDNEALENPVLQMADENWDIPVLPTPEGSDEIADLGEARPVSQEGLDASGNEVELPVNVPSPSAHDIDMSAPLYSRDIARHTSGIGNSEFEPLDHLAGEVSLIARLELTFSSRFFDATDRAIALALLSDVNETGYLTSELDELADRLGVDRSRCEQILGQCQDLAPAGMFARSLNECLRLQLKEQNRLDPAMETLIDHLEDIAAGRSASVRLRCGVNRDDFAAMLVEIRALNPKPGFDETASPTQTVIPDIIVRMEQAGTWRVDLNEDALPRILVDRNYAASITPSLGRSADRQYLVNCLQRATWLEKCLDQRAQTILKVAGEIVRQQEGFLEDGVSSLRPLTLSEVAETVGVHGSTVSRATANKYIATPRGLFPLKFFFSSSLSVTNGNEGLSSEAVKHRVKQLTDNESPDAVLSDDAIAALLSKEGIVIARRTVAKYRDALGIASSAQRRRDFRTSIAS